MDVWVLLACDDSKLDCYGVYPTISSAQAEGEKVWGEFAYTALPLSLRGDIASIACSWMKGRDRAWWLAATGPATGYLFDVRVMVQPHNLDIAQEATDDL